MAIGSITERMSTHRRSSVVSSWQRDNGQLSPTHWGGRISPSDARFGPCGISTGKVVSKGKRRRSRNGTDVMVDRFVPPQTYTWTVSENVITPSSLVVPAVPRHHCKETDDGEHQRGHDGKRGGGVHGARWPFICKRVRNRVRTSVASELNIFLSLWGVA
jgi:hypothetical protein